MKFNYAFSNLCGVSYRCGNVLFTPDGNSLLSCVGNRVTMLDLVNHRSQTLPFEARRNIRRLALSHDGALLVVVDTEGRALLVNLRQRTVLHRFSLKGKVRAVEFRPQDDLIAFAVGRKVQVWRRAGLGKEFAPMALHRTYTGHHDEVTSIGWAPDGRYFVTGSRDMTARVHSLDPEQDFVVVTLTGHKESVLACYFMQDQALGTASADGNALLDLAPAPVIYTVAADGALMVWRWTWTSKQAKREQLQLQQGQGQGQGQGRLALGDDADMADADTGDTLVSGDKTSMPLSIKHGEWRRHARFFLQKDHARIQSAALHARRSDLLVVGFSNGVFSLFDMPSATHIQSLSVSQHELKTAAVNCTGEWVALASANLGQLLVWEWKSETYVLKQQGHFFDLNAVAYSPDGQIMATGGDDAKVKLWSATSGFCFVTFAEHRAPVSALAFVGEGNAVVSASLDGTVRAFDLVRYRNFRTMVTPTPVQLTCLAVDGQGEVVCAGALDPPEIYVWSLQTGKLLDVLAGHEGPVTSLAFAATRPLLASTSWDRSMRLWEPYAGTAPTETLGLGSDGLCVAFRPDGKEACAACLNGSLQFWDVASGEQTGVIDGARDISGGRRQLDRTTARNATHNKHFSSVCYTADGTCVIAGGQSKFVCIYQVKQRILLKKYQLSHNRSLDGVLDKLNSKLDHRDAGPSATWDVSDNESDSDNEDAVGRAKAAALPGAARASRGGGDGGRRTTAPEVRCKAVRFSPTGQEWAAATTQGLMVYSLDAAMIFDPMQLDEDVTPAGVRQLARDGEHGRALTLALHLGEEDVIVEAYRSVPTEAVALVGAALPVVYLARMLLLVAGQLAETPDVEHHLTWVRAILTAHNDRLREQAPQFLAAFRALQKAVATISKDLGALCNDNTYALAFLAQAPAPAGDDLFNIVGVSNGDAEGDAEGDAAKGAKLTAE